MKTGQRRADKGKVAGECKKREGSRKREEAFSEGKAQIVEAGKIRHLPPTASLADPQAYFVIIFELGRTSLPFIPDLGAR